MKKLIICVLVLFTTKFIVRAQNEDSGLTPVNQNGRYGYKAVSGRKYSNSVHL